MKKVLLIVAVVMMTSIFVSFSGSDDDENQLNKWPTGQWL
jgi:hypothetical protein